MEAPSGDTEVAELLVEELNTLLANLLLPIKVETPYDLTPSLLLVILEALLHERLPISAATRESSDPSAKVEIMKVFLGVLEDDVLRTDVGLSEIDPRRLAAGEWSEVVFIGEILCWLGRQRQLLDDATLPALNKPSEPSSTSSNANTSVYDGFSKYDTSETAGTSLPSDFLPDSSSATTPRPISPASAPSPPRCIHEFEDPSFFSEIQSSIEVSEDQFCECSADAGKLLDTLDDEELLHGYPSTSSVRYDGCINPVEDDIEKFVAWQEFSKRAFKSIHSKGIARKYSNGTVPNPTRHTAPADYTRSLLNERARLLTELAKLELSKP